MANCNYNRTVTNGIISSGQGTSTVTVLYNNFSSTNVITVVASYINSINCNSQTRSITMAPCCLPNCGNNIAAQQFQSI